MPGLRLPTLPGEQVAGWTPDRPAATKNAGAGRTEVSVAEYVIGGGTMQFDDGEAMLIPAGSDFVFQFHSIHLRGKSMEVTVTYPDGLEDADWLH